MLKVHECLLASPLRGHYEQLLPQLEQIRYSVSELMLKIDAVTYPMQAGRSQNRLFSLLTWDKWAFTFCLSLFFFMMTLSEWTRLALESGMGDNFIEHAFYTIIGMFTIFSGDFWREWRTQITFQIVKLLFALTAAPFFIFTIGPLAKIFAHADPTAWTSHGRCVKPDTNGLAAYLAFVKSDVLGNRRFADELNQRFPQRDIQRLKRAVVEGEQKLQAAWSRPAVFTRLTIREKQRIDKLLGEIVTKERASAELYKTCFPDKVIVDLYVAGLEAEEQRMKEAKLAADSRKTKVSRLKDKAKGFSGPSAARAALKGTKESPKGSKESPKEASGASS